MLHPFLLGSEPYSKKQTRKMKKTWKKIGKLKPSSRKKYGERKKRQNYATGGWANRKVRSKNPSSYF